jgi:hypothetical protein
MYDYNDWRALSRRLAVKGPDRRITRFPRPLLVGVAIVLAAAGVLNWLLK